MPAHTVFDALHVAVSPVILISAYGLLLLSLTNRLGRAIDRARMLARESESNRAVQIAIIARRAKWIRSAILYVAIAIVSAAVLVLALFLSVFLPTDLTRCSRPATSPPWATSPAPTAPCGTSSRRTPNPSPPKPKPRGNA
jgi:hypothetical protein